MKNAENNISIPASVNIKIQEKSFWNSTVGPGELRKPYRSSWEQYHWEKIFETVARNYDFRDRKILVAGCGTGIFEEWLAKRVRIREMVGMDLSERMIDLARRRCNGIENVHFLVADLDATPFPDRRFDVCVVIDALHHLPDEFRTLKELSRVSSDLVLSEPNALNPIRRLNERRFRKEMVTERSFYKSRIVGAIIGLGYDRVVVRNCHFIPSFMPTFLLSLLRRCELFLERAPILKEFSGSLNIFAYRTFPNPNTIRFQRSE
jgi:SAM-dependent methyltransferase